MYWYILEELLISDLLLQKTAVALDLTLFVSQSDSAWHGTCQHSVFDFRNYWLLGLLPLEFLLCLIRNLKKLALTSLFAQISNLMAFGVVFWFDFDEFHKIKQ